MLASQYQLADISDDISLLVANGFLQIMFNKEILGVQQAQLEVSQAELDRSNQLIKAGVLTIGDIYELEANIATQKQAVVQAENSLRLAKINLAQLLLITDYENFDIEMVDLDVPFSQVMEESPKKVYEKALSFRNDIKLAETNIAIAETDLKLAKGSTTIIKSFLWIQYSFILCRQIAGNGRVYRCSNWFCRQHWRNCQYPC